MNGRAKFGVADRMAFDNLVIVGLQGFFPLKGEAAVGVGAVEYPIAERKRLATLFVAGLFDPLRVTDLCSSLI